MDRTGGGLLLAPCPVTLCLLLTTLERFIETRRFTLEKCFVNNVCVWSIVLLCNPPTCVTPVSHAEHYNGVIVRRTNCRRAGVMLHLLPTWIPAVQTQCFTSHHDSTTHTHTQTHSMRKSITTNKTRDGRTDGQTGTQTHTHTHTHKR